MCCARFTSSAEDPDTPLSLAAARGKNDPIAAYLRKHARSVQHSLRLAAQAAAGAAIATATQSPVAAVQVQ